MMFRGIRSHYKAVAEQVMLTRTHVHRARVAISSSFPSAR